MPGVVTTVPRSLSKWKYVNVLSSLGKKSFSAAASAWHFAATWLDAASMIMLDCSARHFASSIVRWNVWPAAVMGCSAAGAPGNDSACSAVDAAAGGGGDTVSSY